MLALYRVFSYLPSAAEDQPGGALYLPPQAGGRLDNPASYSVLYLSDHPSGAIAEAFGRFPEWTAAMLAGSPGLPGSVRALARYQLPEDAEICNLDDPHRLLSLELRPSDVVSRDYAHTRAWARRIFEEGKWTGIRWWSYYDPQWASFGIWYTVSLELLEVVRLTLTHPALVEAARTIARRVTR